MTVVVYRRTINGKKGKWELDSIYTDRIEGGEHREKEYASNFKTEKHNNTLIIFLCCSRLFESKLAKVQLFFCFAQQQTPKLSGTTDTLRNFTLKGHPGRRKAWRENVKVRIICGS